MMGKDLSYIAGFFDGEGSISLSWQKRSNTLRKRVCRSQISIGNTDYPVLKYIQSCLGGTIHPIRQKNDCWEASWAWKASTKEAATIIERLLPYLRVKAAQAKLLIEYQQHKESIHWPGRRGYTQGEWDEIESYRQKMRSLNANSGNKVNHSIADPNQ